MNYLRKYLSLSKSDILFFLTAIAIGSFSGSIVESIFNNFLNESFNLSNVQRSVIEFPRELPGLIVMLVIAGLSFLCSRKLATFAMVLASIGLLLIGTCSATLTMMLVWLFIFSMGQHLMIPLQSSIGMELAKEGQTGQRLGQLNAIRNLFGILGAVFVFVGFRYIGLNFKWAFIIASGGFLFAGLLLNRMVQKETHPSSVHLKLHKKYTLFYWLSILYGTRKQIFLTFAPWVLVRIYQQPTQTIATLLIIGGVLGIVFQPLLGKLIDTRGERFVLAGEAIILIGVCFFYGYSEKLFPHTAAFLIVCGCYVADQLLMSVGMARATYLKKIAISPDHIMPALSASTSIDHIFSISAAILCGIIWQKWGYQYVFMLGALISVVNFASALFIRIPTTPATSNEAPVSVPTND